VLPFAVTGVSPEPNMGKLIAAPVKTLPLTKFLRPKTKDGNESIESS
jgi:hypothetical protein